MPHLSTLLSTYAPPFLFLPSLGVGELAIIFVIILVLFGPGKLPQVCRALGDGLKQFKNATKDAIPTLDTPPQVPTSLPPNTQTPPTHTP
jgi:sec-independent protein translocase protein TatA